MVAWSNHDGFLYLNLQHQQEELDLTFGLSVKFMRAHPSVKADQGKLAVQYGPLVYAAEAQDNEWPLELYRLSTNDQARLDDQVAGLEGMAVIKLQTHVCKPNNQLTDLYTVADAPVTEQIAELTLVPYFAWGNRKINAMQVWLHERLS